MFIKIPLQTRFENKWKLPTNIWFNMFFSTLKNLPLVLKAIAYDLHHLYIPWAIYISKVIYWGLFLFVARVYVPTLLQL